MGKVATSTLPYWGSPPLERGRQNKKWPTGGQSGYVTPCRLGHPHRLRAGAKSEVAHLWAKWLCHPFRLGDPHRFRAGGGNQKWPTCGQSGYVTPCRLGDPHRLRAGAKSEVAHLWAKWLCHPCRLGDPHRFRAGGGNQTWPTCGQSGYVTPCRLGDPHRCRAGAKSEVAHLWAKWLRHPCRLGDPQRLREGGGNQKWPTCGQSGYVTLAVSGIPTLESGGQNQKWRTCGQIGHVTPAVSGIPTASERGGGVSDVAHKWAKWLRHPCRLRDPHRFRAGRGGIKSGPLVGKVATSPLPSRGSPPLQSGGENQKWPTCGQSGRVTPAVSGIPTA